MGAEPECRNARGRNPLPLMVHLGLCAEMIAIPGPSSIAGRVTDNRFISGRQLVADRIQLSVYAAAWARFSAPFAPCRHASPRAAEGFVAASFRAPVLRARDSGGGAGESVRGADRGRGGGRFRAMGVNGGLGGGEYLVAEADESDGTFLHLTPTVAVVTNVDYEHVDYYCDMDALRAAFAEFLQRVPFYGACVLCVDDPEVQALLPHLDRKTITYGLTEQAEVRADPGTIATGDFGQEAVVWRGGVELGPIRLQLRGRHNLQNALAAVAVGLELEVPFAQIAAGLAGASGVGRRCEEHGLHGEVLVIDDYGHHPTELLAIMSVAREYDRPVNVLFQPHRYSRTVQFAREFADALAGADNVGLLPVYAASETPPEGVDSHLIAAHLQETGAARVQLLAGLSGIAAWLDEVVQPGSLVLTLGAGDIGREVTGICEHLDRRGR